MRHIPGIDRSQVLLLPEAVDDYVGRDNPVRFIDAFVDGLDLAAAGFERAAPKATGRPGYDPADLLKLYIYGYLNRVRSSRRLEAESKRNLEVIWLLRRLSPDFKTIADFRRINRAAFRQVFREFVRLCREQELFGRELVAVDGTRIKAVNSLEAELHQSEAGEGGWPRATRGCRVISTGSTRPTGRTMTAPAAARWRISGRRSLRSKGGVSGLRNIATRWLRVARTSSR